MPLALTQKEAEALYAAAGEALAFPDIAEAVFVDSTERRTAFRAWNKLKEAIVRAR